MFVTSILRKNRKGYDFLLIITFLLLHLILFHVDIWGPYSIPTHEGFKYFLSIVDDATRCTWIYLLKTKSEVRGYLISFYKLIQTQFGTNIKSIRSDNGRVFPY